MMRLRGYGGKFKGCASSGSQVERRNVSVFHQGYCRDETWEAGGSV